MNKNSKVLGRITYWLVWPLLFLRLNGTLRTRVVIVFDDKVLLVNGWLGDSKGGLPGGGVKSYETPEVAAIREVHEEVGITLGQQDLIKLHEQYFKENKIGFELIFYGVKLDYAPKLKLQKFEVVHYSWLDLSGVNENNATKDAVIGVENWSKLA